MNIIGLQGYSQPHQTTCHVLLHAHFCLFLFPKLLFARGAEDLNLIQQDLTTDMIPERYFPSHPSLVTDSFFNFFLF